MPGGTLTGWALSTLAGAAEHTYVVSSEGHVWPCWGRSAGGHSVCSGVGDVAQADCLSQVNSEAGIVYGRTGVCHQTANRILLPAAMVVSSAHGARASILAFGVYGREPGSRRHYHPVLNPWPELVKCLGEHRHDGEDL